MSRISRYFWRSVRWGRERHPADSLKAKVLHGSWRHVLVLQDACAGYRKELLKNPDFPLAAENRRVEIVHLTDRLTSGSD
jgi:hypothetical protein